VSELSNRNDTSDAMLLRYRSCSSGSSNDNNDNKTMTNMLFDEIITSVVF
jgi:hypothetical protein